MTLQYHYIHAMNLLDIYSALQSHQISQDEAADALGLSVHDLRFRLTRWGHRLPLLLSVLDKIRSNEISRPTAAATLAVSVRQVNYLMRTWRVERPIPSYLIDQAAAQIKWEVRKKYAIEYIAGSCTIEEAAENADVSERQIRRWVSDLLRKHFGMVWKDLKEVTDHRRKRLADEIERAEGLEYAKQNVIRAVSTGEKSINDVALEIVVNHRKPKHVRRVKEKAHKSPSGPPK